jgi:integrase
MRGLIGVELLRKLPITKGDIRDTKLPGFVLRVRPTGHHTYMVNYARGRWEVLGTTKVLTPPEAREQARQMLADVTKGADPVVERRKRKAGTLKGFLAEHYGPWVTANRRTGDQTLTRIAKVFPDLLNKPIHEITAFQLEQWRSARRKLGRKDTTINRDLDSLRAVLTKAVQWRVVTEHPMRDVRRARVDAIGRLRYLSPAEETRLRAALVARDDARRDGRRRFNDWRAERGYKTLPDLGVYPDHLTPITLLALNTGLRRGELLGLTWGDVDLTGARLTVRGHSAKTGLTRYLPLNTEAVTVLQTWQPAKVEAAAFVFPGPDGGRMHSLKTAWWKVAKDAKLTAFTFHDLRHTFASKLVQAGVDLNTVRELLGHADIKMTLRYAHLAPEHRAAAVAKLVKGA